MKFSFRKKGSQLFTALFLVFQFTPLSGINPLFDNSLSVNLVTKERKNAHAERKRVKHNAIYLFREGHKFDTLAIKTLAKSGHHIEAKELLTKAKTYFHEAAQLDPHNTLIQAFYEAHDNFADRVVVPGNIRAKCVLVRLYDPNDDDIDSEFDVTLNDPDMCAYWQASKLSPSDAVEAMEPKPDNPEDRVSNNTKWGSAITLCSLTASAGFAIAESLTETTYLHYIGGASGGATGFLLYLTAFGIFKCCMNQHDAARGRQELDGLITALDDAFGDDKDDDDAQAPAVRINIRGLTGRAVATSGPTEDEMTVATRRKSSLFPEETETDVLQHLDSKYKKLYQERLQKFGPEDKFVKEVLKRNREKMKKAEPYRRGSLFSAQTTMPDEDEDDGSDADEVVTDSDDASPDQIAETPATETTTTTKTSKKKKRKSNKRVASLTEHSAYTPDATDGDGDLYRDDEVV